MRPCNVDYDAYGDKMRWQPFGYPIAAQSRPTARKPIIPWRKRLYRHLGQMFLRWAETAGDE